MHATFPPGLVVAGTKSGCGKTSVALALMRALRRRGHAVQGFKVGPDFIDPGLHTLATGRTSHNLDGWMCPPNEVRAIYSRHAAGADAAVVEGVMGLFDGFSATDEAGSTAQAAKLLGLPVVLVLDAASMARSVAAMAGGYLAFDPGLRFAGVICNNAATPSHAALLAEAMAAALPRVPLLAVLPRQPTVTAPSRHLGLVTADDLADAETRLDALADWLEEACDVEGMMRKVSRKGDGEDASGGQGAALDLPGGIIPPGPPGRGDGGRWRSGGRRNENPPGSPARGGVRIGVARDRAFCFYYEENFRHLREAGAALVPFSPLEEETLPKGLDGLYLGGGYPELSGDRLAANTGLRRAVRAFCQAGRPVLAECGGFMFLMESLIDPAGTVYPMAGVFPFRAVMGDRLAALGYRQATTRVATPLGPAGTVVRGHEFHYSRLVDDDGSVPGIYALRGRLGDLDAREGFLLGQTLGSYVHLHFGSNPQAARNFVAACREGR